MTKLQFIKIVSVEGITTRTLIKSTRVLDLPDGLVITSNTADLSYCTEVPNCNRLR